jgi:solute carrier family 8 (sodium/calcium exchanger)
MVDEYDVIDPVTCEETCMHFFSMPWKVLFAVLPPSHIGGGWPTLFMGLAVMVGITYVISELATAIGCLLNMCTAIQALTIISLGFNLPEFYASQLAAEGLRSINAEPSIGFIPGANAMKIFLGLGLPWTIKSIMKSGSESGILCIGTDHTGELSFVSLLLAVLSLLVFLLLLYRRATNKGELGGPTCSRALSSCFLVVLWFVFVVIVSLNCFDYLSMKDVFKPDTCG